NVFIEGKPPISHNPSESMSQTAVVTPPSIDGNGVVYSGSGAGGDVGTPVGRATIQFNQQGLAFWVANYSNVYGSAEPVRAPQYDRPAGNMNLGGPRPGTGNPGGMAANWFRTGPVRLVNNY